MVLRVHVASQQEPAGTQPLRAMEMSWTDSESCESPRNHVFRGPKGRGCWWGENAREQEAECLEAGTPIQAEPEEQERREGEQTGGRVDRLEALLIMGVQGVTEAPG